MESLKKVRKWLEESGYDGIILTRRDNYAWLTGGDENHVLASTELGIAHLIVTRNELTLLADSSDARRMEEEQNSIGAKVILVPWYENMEAVLKQHINAGRTVSDTGILDTVNVQERLVDLRLQLSDKEIDTYKSIGQECAEIVEQVCMKALPGQSEAEVANQVRQGCFAAGISPDCVLVGSDERILRYRHPMPTEKEIEKSLMVVLGGQKKGLNISMTRIVYFGGLPEETAIKYQHNQEIFASMQLMMQDGMPYRDYFAGVQKLYARFGYADEWKLHHQGGPTGYGCREMVIGPESDGAIRHNQAYAWNPTITGVKCEETTFLGAEEGIVTFTAADMWPRKNIKTAEGVFSVADILEK